MNRIHKHDLKLASTLKSLSIEPSAKQSEPSSQSTRRPIIYISLTGLIIIVILSVFFWRQIKLHNDIPTREVKELEAVVPVKTITSGHSITGSGYVTAPQTTLIFSKYEGRISEIQTTVGAQVKKGQALIQLTNTSALLAVKQAEAEKVLAELNLAAKQILLDQARTEFTRSKTLAQQGTTSRQVLEKNQSALQTALNDVDQAQQTIVKAQIAILKAQDSVDELTIRSPFDGTVSSLKAHIGDSVLVRDSSVRENQSLLTVTDTDNLVIDADVAETSIALMAKGLHGEAILDGYPDQPFGIQIIQVAPVVSSQKGTVTIRLSIHNPPEGIRPNMAARIQINPDQPTTWRN